MSRKNRPKRRNLLDETLALLDNGPMTCRAIAIGLNKPRRIPEVHGKLRQWKAAGIIAYGPNVPSESPSGPRIVQTFCLPNVGHMELDNSTPMRQTIVSAATANNAVVNAALSTRTPLEAVWRPE